MSYYRNLELRSNSYVAYKIETVKRIHNCHDCKVTMKKGTKRVNFNLGRILPRGHYWAYLLCFSCGKKFFNKKIAYFHQAIDEIKSQEENRKWVKA